MANLSATIDKEVKKKFDEFCENNGLNNSEVIEKLINKFLKKNRNIKVEFD